MHTKLLKFISFMLFTCFISVNMAVSQEQSPEPTDAKMLRFPDVSKDKIVFVYAGDIWSVDKEGGVAARLSSPKGQELFPKFSPDGKTIAFSGNYDGNVDVYLMPSTGGEVKRLTHHPDDDYVVDWYPDSSAVLYKSEMLSPVRRFNKLFRQPVNGRLPQKLPLPYGEWASFNHDATKMAFQIVFRDARTWKRYRGGMASDVWIYDFAADQASKLTEFEGNDSLAMWHGDIIYFLSDRGENKKNNIWKINTSDGTTKQVTYFKQYDVKWPSLGPDSIIFENGGKIFLLDLQTEQVNVVNITVPADLPDIRPALKNLQKYIESYELSPSGKQALFEARGEIFLIGSKNEIIQNLTNTSGAAEIYPSWSSKEDRVAYLSDESGEYQIVIRNLDDQTTKAINLAPGYYYSPLWSGDGKFIAVSNNKGELFVADTESGDVKLVDKDEWSRIGYYSWSPDNRLLAYSKDLDNDMSSVFIYDLQSSQSTQITGDFYNDYSPVFGDDGKYITFLSNRHFRPAYSDMDQTWIYPGSSNIYLVSLQEETLSPFLPKPPGFDPKKVQEPEPKKRNRSRKDTFTVSIDYEGIDQRIIKIPVGAGNIKYLQFVGNKIFYIKSGGFNGIHAKGNLTHYDLGDKKEKILMRGVNSYNVSKDGKQYLYKTDKNYGVATADKENKPGAGKLATNKLTAFIDFKEEWRQIFNEAWRIERDFFYDPNMHGVDWLGVKQRYEKLLQHIVSREDLNYLLGEMVGELNSSHTYVKGGDYYNGKNISVGMPGCDFGYDSENDAFYFGTIYNGGNSSADLISPLVLPGMNVKEGDYVLAVNGVAMDTSVDPWASFQNMAGTVVELTVNSKPTLDGSKKILVKMLDRKADLKLRYLNWIQANRKKVDDATGGEVGYIYVPDTGTWGQNELVRQFTPQVNKKALIIDERFNGGGQVPDRFIELLNRPVFNYWARREQNSLKSPFLTHTGPKVMLINGWSGSGGDAFPHYFKKAGLGKLIGQRTLGGLIGIGGYPKLIDGGYVSTPNFAFLDTDGQWNIEGYGVDPDYEVENLSLENPDGHDPQLDKAIELLKDSLKDYKFHVPKIPEYPDKSN